MTATRRIWLVALAFLVVAFLAYQPAWQAGFIWDDDEHLTANPAMTAPDGLRMIWSSLAISRYYPLTLTSFWVQHRLWGMNPMPYHLVNIALHAINGLLIFLILRRLRIPAAWLPAALWLVHPVNVESVAWVTEAKNTQSGFFFFCAVLCFLQEHRRWYALAVVCGACAMLSKPSTVVLPAVLLLCDWWERRVRIVRTIPFFALALGMSLLTIVEQRGHIARQGEAEWTLRLAERFLIAGQAVWFYAWKVVWPATLVFVYPRWKVLSWLPLAGAMAVGVGLWLCRRQPWARAGSFGLGFFVVALLPVLGFFDVFYFRYSYVADHFQYLASLGIIACAASGITHAPVRAALLVTLAGLTWSQCHIYRNHETLWQDTVAKNPSAWMAHDLLGYHLTKAGKLDEAMRHFKQALQLKPDYPEAHNNLGVALVQAGQIQEALGHYEQAVRFKPQYADAHYNLGSALARLGRVEEAAGHWELALQFNPDIAEAHNNLGSVLMGQGRLPEAINHFEQALRIRPDYPTARFNLAAAQEAQRLGVTR